MIRNSLEGVQGTNPLGFMAAVGLLRLLTEAGNVARLGFAEDGAFYSWIECNKLLDIPGIVARDAATASGPQPWRLEYEKQEKRGIKIVADLKAPPEVFSKYLDSAIKEWLADRPEQSEYAAAYATDIARDGSNKRVKPTALHFTAANQHFLETVEKTRNNITREWVEASLQDLDGKSRSGENLRWDPDSDRSRALMGVDPNQDGTRVNAPLEWLAFRSLPAFPTVPVGNRIVTCSVIGRRQRDMRFVWPLWSSGATYNTVRSLLLHTADWIQREERLRSRTQANFRSIQNAARELEKAAEARRSRSIFAICLSEIRRTTQGFGNFGPAEIRV